MVLDFGGDDITSFLLTLLLRINFPYKEADLTKWYDWVVIEDLKERLVVLSEVRTISSFFFRTSFIKRKEADGREWLQCAGRHRPQPV